MSTERWDDDRLDRLANSVEALTNRVDNIANSLESLTKRVDSIAISTENNNRAIENNNRLIESNARVIQALANVAAEAREERQQLFQIMAQQQEEIRGIQTENRRTLDILLNQRDRGDNPTA